MKRRDFLKRTGITIATAPIVLNSMKVRAIRNSLLMHAGPNNDKILVVIFLNGGNDGLNMVIPLDQYDNLANVRSNIIIPENKILNLTTTNGLHPAASGLKSIFDDGMLAIVQSVGYPNQNRSHFRSTDIYNSASAAEVYEDTGWLGRWMDLTYPGYPDNYPNTDTPDPIAITMVSRIAETCQGTAINYSYSVEDPFDSGTLPVGALSPEPDSPYGDELKYIRQTIDQTNKYSAVVKQLASAGTNTVTYPDTDLGQQLKNIALLISGGCTTKVYYATIGGFDTHSEQVMDGDTTMGEHADLIKELSDAIYAFQTDMKNQGLSKKVLGMTYTEFGRRIRSNASMGTDHGTAAPSFLFGECVQPGFIGDNPVISPNVSQSEGVPMQYDFRALYGTILNKWFEVPQGTVDDLLFENFPTIPVVSPCDATASNEIYGTTLEADITPNPFLNKTEVEFKTDLRAKVLIQVFDAMGSLVLHVSEDTYLPGTHRVGIDADDLPAGVYYCRVVMGSAQKTIRMVKADS